MTETQTLHPLPFPVAGRPQFTGTAEQIAALLTALNKAQGAFPKVLKGQENTFYGSKYADLAAYIDATREPLFKNGLLCFQTWSTESFPEDETRFLINLTTVIGHTSGGMLSFEITAQSFGPIDRDGNIGPAGPQDIGKTVTYLRRYAYGAVMNLAAEDDDLGSGTSQARAPARRAAAPAASAGVPAAPGATVLTFGKYRGKTLDQVWVEDQNYLAWLTDNAKEPAMRDRARALFAQHQQAAAMGAPPADDDGEPPPFDMPPVDAYENG